MARGSKATKHTSAAQNKGLVYIQYHNPSMLQMQPRLHDLKKKRIKCKETSKETKYANIMFNEIQEVFWEKDFLQVHRFFYDDQSEQVWKTLS